MVNFAATHRTKSTLALIMASMLWSISGQLTLKALYYLDPLTLLALRFFVSFFAAIIATSVLAFSQCRDTERHLSIKPYFTDAPYALMLSLPLVIVYLASTYALYKTTPAINAFIAGASILIVPLLQWALEKKSFNLNMKLKTLLAFTGLTLIALQGRFSLQINTGVLLSLLQATAYAIYIFMGSKLPINDPPRQSRVNVMQYGFVFVMLLCFIYLAPNADLVSSPINTLNLTPLIAILALGILSTFLPFTLQLRAQVHIEAHLASRILALIPLFTALFDAFLGYSLSTYTLIGGFLILSVQVEEKSYTFIYSKFKMIWHGSTRL